MRKTGIESQGQNIDVIFAYTLGNGELYFCEPSKLAFEINESKFESNIGNFYLRSFFADEDESCSQHFINILQQAYFEKNVERIVMVADNVDINIELTMMFGQGKINFFMLKNYHESEIDVPVEYVNIDYPIAYSLGLKRSEL